MPKTLEERKAALREYLESAEDRDAARAFIVECLDPVTDSELLTWLEETFPLHHEPENS